MLIPSNSKLRVLDASGAPMSGIGVWIYKAVPGDGSSGAYSQLFDNVADLTGTTDSNGLLPLGTQPFGDIDQYGTPVGVDLVKLRNAATSEVRYVWLELTDFNIAYWTGSTTGYVRDLRFPSGSLRLTTDRSSLSFSAPAGSRPRPQSVDVRIAGNGVGMWSVGSPSRSWLHTSPSSLLSDQEFMPGTLAFQPDAAGLSPGTYTADVTVSAQMNGSTASETIHVALTVGAPDSTPPTVYVPTAWILSAQTTGSTTKVRLVWPTASDASGIDGYTLQKSVDSGSWTTVMLPSPTATTVDLALETGHYYRFRLRATDTAGNTSAYVTTANARFARAQESSTAVKYTGSWSTVSLSGASGGYVRKSATAGNTATFSFSGTSVAWASTKGTNRGIAEVWLDGVKVATVDLYASTLQTARVVWSSGTIAAGSHTLRVKVTGTKNASSSGVRVDIDCFLRRT